MCFSRVVKCVSPFAISESTVLWNLIFVEFRLPLFVNAHLFIWEMNYSDACLISDAKETILIFLYMICANFWIFSCESLLLLNSWWNLRSRSINLHETIRNLYWQGSCLANRYFLCPQLIIARKCRVHAKVKKRRKCRALVCACPASSPHVCQSKHTH